MKISQDVRDYAQAKGIEDEKEALALGLVEKSKQFIEEGAEIYHKA
jgi:phosphomethylpyrimidine synthase